MADQPVTREKLINADIDVENLGKAVNEKVVVNPRYGVPYKSIPLVSAEFYEKIIAAQNKINEWNAAIALITQQGGVPALAVSDASGKDQQQVNDINKMFIAGSVDGEPVAQLKTGIVSGAKSFYDVDLGLFKSKNALTGSINEIKKVTPDFALIGVDNSYYYMLDEVNTQRPQNYQYTQMGKAFDSREGVNDNAGMWPHANIKYDATTDNFIIIYNTNSGHEITTNSVLFRTLRAGTDKFSAPIVVASEKNVKSYKCQASGIAKNGDYVALIGEFNWGSFPSTASWAYRSSDKGLTWSRTKMLDSSNANAPILAYNADVTGFLVSDSGRIHTFADHPDTLETRIYYSDDNGVTWSKSSIAGNPTDVTEPAWCDLGGGVLICYARASVRFGGVHEIIPAKYMYSLDDGLTWSAPVNSKSITNFTLSNGELLVDKQTKTVEFVFHSRYTDADNYCSLYRSCATFADAFNDNFSKQERIGKMVAYTPYLSSQGDSGYVGAAKDKNGNIFGMFYTGQRTGTTGLSQLSYFVAGKSKKQGTDFVLDYRSGEKIYYSDIIPVVTPSSTTQKSIDLYLSGKTKVTELTSGIMQGSGGSGSWIQNATNLSVSVSGVAGSAYRSSIQTVDAIDLTHIKTISVKVDSYSSTGSLNDVALAVYSTKTVSPSYPLTNRLLISGTKVAGILNVDVSSLHGSGYIHLVATSNESNPTNTTLSATISEIKLIGYDGEIFELSSQLMPTKSKVYDRGFYFAGLSGAGAPVTLNTGTNTVATTGGFIHLQTTSSSATTTYSTAIVMQNAIPRKATYVSCDMLCDGGLTAGVDGDFGIAIFSKNNPTGVSDGRVVISFSDVNGKRVLKLPAAVETADHYVGIVLNHKKTSAVNLRVDNLKYHFS